MIYSGRSQGLCGARQYPGPTRSRESHEANAQDEVVLYRTRLQGRRRHARRSPRGGRHSRTLHVARRVLGGAPAVDIEAICERRATPIGGMQTWLTKTCSAGEQRGGKRSTSLLRETVTDNLSRVPPPRGAGAGAGGAGSSTTSSTPVLKADVMEAFCNASLAATSSACKNLGSTCGNFSSSSTEDRLDPRDLGGVCTRGSTGDSRVGVGEAGVVSTKTGAGAGARGE